MSGKFLKEILTSELFGERCEDVEEDDDVAVDDFALFF